MKPPKFKVGDRVQGNDTVDEVWRQPGRIIGWDGYIYSVVMDSPALNNMTSIGGIKCTSFIESHLTLVETTITLPKGENTNGCDCGGWKHGGGHWLFCTTNRRVG